MSYASYESESNHEQMNIEEVEDKSAYINEKDQETQISTKVEDIVSNTFLILFQINLFGFLS